MPSGTIILGSEVKELENSKISGIIYIRRRTEEGERYMELFIIRHGNTFSDFFNPPDPPLSQAGERQAEFTGKRISREKIDFFYASPLRRTLKTAVIINRYLHLPIYAWSDLAEQNEHRGGNFLSLREIKEKFEEIEVDKRLIKDNWWKGIKNDENESYLRAGKVEKFLRETFEEKDVSILLVSHGTFGGILISKFLNLPPCGYARFSEKNCSISCLEITPGRVKLRYLNRTGHIPDELIT